MNTALWVVQGILAFAFFGAGCLKLLGTRTYKEKIAWRKDVSPTTVRLIGLVELLGAIGVVAPWATGIEPILTPIAAAGLAVTMLVGFLTHVKYGQMDKTPPSLVLMALAAFVAYGRFAG